MNMTPNPEVSVIVPVYNEEDGLQALYDRLYTALDALGTSYEIVFINDGSRDRSAAILRQQWEKRPDVTRVTSGRASNCSRRIAAERSRLPSLMNTIS